MESEREFIEIGAVRRAHGIRGQLRVQLHDPESPALRAITRVLIGDRTYALSEKREVGGGAYLLEIEGVCDRDAAEALRGRPLLAYRADLPPLDEDEFYVSDLIGCAAVLPDGTPLGSVVAVPLLGGQEFLTIARPGRAEVLLPLRPEFLRRVDLPGRQVEVEPPEGLLDLDLPAGPEKAPS